MRGFQAGLLVASLILAGPSLAQPPEVPTSPEVPESAEPPKPPETAKPTSQGASGGPLPGAPSTTTIKTKITTQTEIKFSTGTGTGTETEAGLRIPLLSEAYDWLRRAALYGGLEERTSHLGSLASYQDVGGAGSTQTLSPPAVLASVQSLSNAYARRASRQQRLMDAAAGVVFFGGLGTVLSSGAGTTTPKVWAGVTVAPLFVSQAQANEPTRDLFHSGVQGLRVLTYRFHALTEIKGHLERAGLDAQSATSPPISFGPTCATRTVLQSNLISLKGTVNERLITEFETAAEPLFVARAALDQSKADLNQVSSFYRAFEEKALRHLARDVLALDHKILQSDRALRYSPMEALGMMLATPLELVTTTLTGRNLSQYENLFKTSQAIGELDMQLSTVWLPELKPAVVVADLNPAVTSQVARTTKAEVVDCLTEAHSKLKLEASRQATAHYWANEARRVVKANHLTFKLDWTTGVATINLIEPPAPQAPPVVSVTTSTPVS